MEEFHGIVTELGASTTAINRAGTNSLTTYPYIEIGGKTVKKIKAFPGIQSKLQAALAAGEPASIYIQSGYLCGVKMPDGRVFAASGQSFLGDLFETLLVLVAGLLLSVFVIGIPLLLWGMWHYWGVWSFRAAKASLPGAIVV